MTTRHEDGWKFHVATISTPDEEAVGVGEAATHLVMVRFFWFVNEI